MTDKKISVIVVTYNQEATIGRALDSILAQDFELPYEIVVGDDASTDGTRAILEEYRKNYPDIIRLRLLPVNRGVRENYITCLLDCHGRYIADCAGDDFWTDKTRLRRQYEMMENDPTLSVVHTAWDYYNETSGERTPGDPDGKRAPYCEPIADGRNLLPAIVGHFNHLTIHLCTALYRFDRFMEAYIEDPELFRYPRYTCEDLQLSAVLAASGRVAFMPESTLCYSVGGDSVSHSKDPRREFEYFWGVMKLTRRLQQKFNIEDQHVQPYYDRIIDHMSAIALRLNDRVLLADIDRLEVPRTVKSRLLSNQTVWNVARAVKSKMQ
ncbi:MAG: glycosyltransferase [Muribaculum sp.]|nr:glycosyltransferase [Muribaculum sp.]